MAMITDEQMFEVSSIIGQAYVRDLDAVGDDSTPGSTTYELSVLESYVDNLLPDAGIVSGCLASSVDASSVTVAAGVVVSDGVSYTTEESSVSAGRTFQYDFAATCQYGFVVAFSRMDMAALGTAARTTTSAALTAGVSTQIALTDATLLTTFDVPFRITVGTEDVDIWAVSGGAALISPDYNGGTGTIVGNHGSGILAFVSKPLRPKIVFGLPVDATHQTGGDPRTFAYYPPVSDRDYVIIARGLVSNPRTVDHPSRIHVIDAIEDRRDLVDVAGSDPFTTTEASAISSMIEVVRSGLAATAGGGAVRRSIYTLVQWSTSENGMGFATYWDDRPFVARSNFLRGESFGGLTRFEFSDDFKRAYLSAYGTDLLTTFAIFRGDIFGGQATYGSPPAGLTTAVTPQATPAAGNISQGTWVYRVSAVTASGETSPGPATPVYIDPGLFGPYNSVTLSWTAVAGAIRYHVYRLGSSGVIPAEYRLTEDTGAREVTSNSFTDIGDYSGTLVRRGVSLTGKTVSVPTQLMVYVPQVGDGFNIFYAGATLDPAYTEVSTATQNEVVLTIYGLKSDGTIGGPHTVTVPKGTVRGTAFPVGTSSDLYVGVYDVVVTPGTSLNTVGGKVSYSPYDLITVQNV